jgi:drug/metabolite transporter (DMT)-like permease
MDKDALGQAAALGSAAAWAVGAFLFKALGEILSPLAMTLAKGACSVVLLGAAIGVTVGLAGGGLGPMTGQQLALLVASGVLGIALGDTFFFEALQGLSPQTLLVLVVLGQVVTVLLAVVVLNEPIREAAHWVGIALVIAGVTVVLSGTLASEEQRATKVRGMVFGLLAVVVISASTLVAKMALGDDSATMEATFVRMLAGTLGVFAYGVTTGRIAKWATPFRDRRLFVRFVGSVAVVTFGGFWLGLVAFKYTKVAVASTLTSTEPVFGLILAAVFLRERVTARAVLGTGVTVLGVVLLSVRDVDDQIRRLLAGFW